MKIRTNRPRTKIYKVVTTKPPIDLIHKPMTVKQLYYEYLRSDFGVSEEELDKVNKTNDTFTVVDNFSKVLTLFTYYTGWEVQSVSSFIIGSSFYYTITFYRYI